MATFSFNQQLTKQIKKNIENAPQGRKVYFQPTHHGGCVQVLSNDNYPHSYAQNVFCTVRTGYDSFRKETSVADLQDAYQIPEDWISKILESKSVKFIAKCSIKTNSIKHSVVFYK